MEFCGHADGNCSASCCRVYFLVIKDLIEKQTGTLSLTSTDFENNGVFHKDFVCDTLDGKNVNPALSIVNQPAETLSMAITMVDTTATATSLNATHWFLWNIPPNTTDIARNSVPEGATQGKNYLDTNKYEGPCPPPNEEHTYVFTLYCLSEVIETTDLITIPVFLEAIRHLILKEVSLTGKYNNIVADP